MCVCVCVCVYLYLYIYINHIIINCQTFKFVDHYLRPHARALPLYVEGTVMQI